MTDILSQGGLEILGPKQVEQLSSDEQRKVLAVQYSVNSTDRESIVGISFTDYITNQPVASIKGAYGKGWNAPDDLNHAEKIALQKLNEMMDKEL